MNLGPTELLVILMFLGAMVVIPLYAVVDALRVSDARWQAIGQSRSMWVAAILAGTFLGGLFGVVLALVYLVATRPKLAGAR